MSYKIPQIIKDQPGYRIDRPMKIMRSLRGGFRLYCWISGGWMDASLEDRPALEPYENWQHNP